MITRAIVGCSKFNNKEDELKVRKLCEMILCNTHPNTLIISGGANGVDSIAIEVAKELGFNTHEYLPSSNTWTDFKKRNILMASHCDNLVCITTKVYKQKCYHHKSLQDHEKTAGCWTLNKTKELNKPARLYVV